MATKVPKKTVRRVATGTRPVRKTSTVSLKQPAWKKWIVRPLTLSQAAIITMGWEPVPGLKKILSERPLKLKELRRREREIEQALSAGLIPKIGRGLPRRVALQDALGFAKNQGWASHKNAQKILDFITAYQDGASGVDLLNPVELYPPAEEQPKVQFNENPKNEDSGVQVKNDSVKNTRLEESLLRIISAMSFKFEELAKKHKIGNLLHGESLNVSSLADSIESIIMLETSSPTPISGFTEGAIRRHIADARKRFFINLLQKSGAPE